MEEELKNNNSLEFNKKYNNKSVRKSVTIPSWLNDLAEKNNVNFINTNIIYK